jgi:hypothetical protein
VFVQRPDALAESGRAMAGQWHIRGTDLIGMLRGNVHGC